VESANKRPRFRVCEDCKDIIFTPISEQLIKFDRKKTKFIEVCRKCKNKE